MFLLFSLAVTSGKNTLSLSSMSLSKLGTAKNLTDPFGATTL